MNKSAFDSIKECIDEKKSFCFNAGAGSGKTFSLVQTIDYILKKQSVSLKNNNQKILVITYTNAAANEIIDRIGSTKLIDVSTIHERIWYLIKGFQNDLISIHLESINREIETLEVKINENPFCKDSILNQNIENSDNSEFKIDFYKYRTLKADELKNHLKRYTSNGISNVAKFKEYVNSKFKLAKLKFASQSIQDKKPKYTKVEYDPLINHDILYKMKFSHDTLIEYANQLIEKNRIIKRIIIDTYPYILVDEFQDTNPKIIALLQLLDKLSAKKCMVGYFGDMCQNIYEDGVGNKLNSIHKELSPIEKLDNRRSARKIIELANKIRNDSFSQYAYLDDEGTQAIKP